MRARQKFKNMKKEAYKSYCTWVKFYGREVLSYRKWLKEVNRIKLCEKRIMDEKRRDRSCKR